MKKSILPLFLILLLVACDSPESRHGDAQPAPDVSDLIMTGEVQKLFALRREALLDTIDDGIMFLRADYGYDGGRHEYRVASNFWYLTGYDQPGTIMSLSKAATKPYVLYTRERSIRDVIYSGQVPGRGEIMKRWAADTVVNYNEAEAAIADAARVGGKVYIDFRDQLFRSRVMEIMKQGNAPDGLVKDIGPSINEMRVYKDDHEVRMLQKAIDITGKALSEALGACKPGMYEFEIEALLEYNFRRNGSSMPGFESIVGSGEKTVTLHYSANNKKMEDGDLLLMDIGAEYGYYTADITRTIPVNGRFTQEQRQIYDLVLRAQKEAIKEMKPGNGMTAAHRRATEVIMEGLHEMGLVTDPGCQWQRKFYTIYHIYHYLGLDVHDVGSSGIPASMARTFVTADTVVGRPLEKGMVLTAEPGIYLRAGALDQLKMLYGSEATEEEIDDFIEKVGPVYEKYKNIGVRLEDDILITGTGNVILSASIPKEPGEIEKLMKRGDRKGR